MTESEESVKSHENVTSGWDLVLVGMLGWIVFKIPLDLVFNLHGTSLFLILDLMISGMLLTDVYLSGDLFNKKDAKKSRSPLVMFAVAPLYAVALLLGLNAVWVPLIQINHLFGLPYLLKRFALHGQSKLLGKRVKLFFILIATFLLMHCLACLWLYLQPSGDDVLTQYNRALYWTITTITTVGYGDITPHSNIARSFAMLVMLLGVLFYGVVIGQISRFILSADRRKEAEKEKLENLTAFFNHYDIPANLQAETFRYYKYMLEKSVIESESKILQELPDGLRSKLQDQINIKPLSRISLFRDCSKKCLLDIAQALEPAHFNPGDLIVKSGDEGAEMYMIRYGRVRINVGDRLVAEMADGQCFGEMSLVNSEPRTADVTAETLCDLFVLRKPEFDRLVGQYETLAANVASINLSRRNNRRAS